MYLAPRCSGVSPFLSLFLLFWRLLPYTPPPFFFSTSSLILNPYTAIASSHPSLSNFHLHLPRRAIGPAITIGKSSSFQPIWDWEHWPSHKSVSISKDAEFVRICNRILHFKVDFQGLFCSIDFYHYYIKYTLQCIWNESKQIDHQYQRHIQNC